MAEKNEKIFLNFLQDPSDIKGHIKHIFRFFRGELNGFYLRTICTFLNEHLVNQGILDALVYAAKSQWLKSEDVTFKQLALSDTDVFNITKIGGLFNPRLFGETTFGSVWFAPSSRFLHPSKVERSERGLVRKSYDDFIFVRVSQDTYPTDINKEATEALRTTLVEQGATVLGYIAEDTVLFTEDGRPIIENVLTEPPVGIAYIEWYGVKYLHMEELFSGVFPLTPDVLMLLFESVQRIRRRGASIETLLEITNLIVEGYVDNLNIVWHNGMATCHYKLNEFAVVHNKDKRYRAWLKICEMKFKQFTFAIDLT